MSVRDIKQLDILKKNIELLEKIHQVEVLRIIHKEQSNILNENKNGIYINMSSLDNNTLDLIKEYMKHIYTQEQELNINEKLKEEFLKTYF
tara:strand:+ start:372 stop:644 length:273 start_codon:yes stop_codon:yes gene_type:complete